MRRLLLLGLLFFYTSQSQAREFVIGNNLIVQGEIVSASSSCIIIETKNESGESLYWIVSEIANALLPDAANFICLKIVGRDNQQICDFVYEGVNFLTTAVSLAKSVPKFIANAIEFIAEKGTISSFLRFSTQSLDFAFNIKSTLDASKKLGIFNWTDVSLNYEPVEEEYLGSVFVSNVTSKPVSLSFSNDGVNWNLVELQAGKYKKIEVSQNGKQQNYGFIKGPDMCHHQIFMDKQYKIRWDKLNKKYLIELI